MVEQIYQPLQNPTFQYNETGLFEVDLKAINAYGSDWENKTAYINVSSVFCPAPPAPEIACFNQTGNITLSLESRSQSSMKWNWNATENITVLSVDSIFRYFDPVVGNFTVIGVSSIVISYNKNIKCNRFRYAQLHNKCNSSGTLATRDNAEYRDGC